MIRLFTLFLLLFLLLGCPLRPAPPREILEPTIQPETTMVAELFVFQPESGVIEFETNDLTYWSPRGFSVWGLLDRPAENFLYREVELAKLAGNPLAGYGLVCSHTAGPGGDSMLVIMINTRQEYIVAEVIGTVFTEIVPWTKSAYLQEGYNGRNVLTLEYRNEEFFLSINGHEEVRFRDNDAPLHTYGRMGYIVVVSPADDFPANPVIAMFKEL